MKYSKSLIFILALIALIVYLFVSAPPPLPDAKRNQRPMVPVKVMFEILAAEQAVARATYTAQVVGPGLAKGLKFSEAWKDGTVDAGPLPAVFLREVSTHLQGAGTEVGLFLGSDYPISPVNKFAGTQIVRFEAIKKSGKPEYFRDAGTGLYTAMFLDPAGAPSCVNCHNQHVQSPKKDWQLNDPMGATTWLYPRGEVTVQEIVSKLAVLRRSVRDVYQTYLDRAVKYTDPAVVIGDQWPKDGLFLPDADHFMEAVSRETSEKTLKSLMTATGDSDVVPAQ